MSYWYPSQKYQLVEWLQRYDPFPHKPFRSMRKKQLWAIYHNVRQRLLGVK